jgi:hypothetical protein
MQKILLQIPKEVDEAQDYRLLADVGHAARCCSLFPAVWSGASCATDVLDIMSMT